MIVLDTSFIVSYYNEKDENHNKALEVMQTILTDKYGEVCISDYIFDECATVILVRLKDLEKTIKICDKIKQSILFKIEESIFELAWNIFKNQKETIFSFTDCTILALMEKESIKNIATFDEDFKMVKEINVIE